MTSNHANMQNVQWQANLASKLNQIKLQERNNQLFAKPMLIVFGLWSHRIKKMYLITKEIELPDIQVKLINSHSKVINIHSQIIDNFLQNE